MTTLASALSSRLSLPLIAQDTIKEAIMRVLDVADVETSQQIGAAAIETLVALAGDSKGAVLESVWRRGLARPQMAALDGDKVEVFCECPPDVARERYLHRASGRAAGHFDGIRGATDDLWTGDTAEPLGGPWPLARVDTSAPIEIDELVLRVQGAFTSSG
jgi:predicted kinase